MATIGAEVQVRLQGRMHARGPRQCSHLDRHCPATTLEPSSCSCACIRCRVNWYIHCTPEPLAIFVFLAIHLIALNQAPPISNSTQRLLAIPTVPLHPSLYLFLCFSPILAQHGTHTLALVRLIK
jgi:hypothetical protein